jgi:hypothetical protein
MTPDVLAICCFASALLLSPTWQLGRLRRRQFRLAMPSNDGFDRVYRYIYSLFTSELTATVAKLDFRNRLPLIGGAGEAAAWLSTAAGAFHPTSLLTHNGCCISERIDLK